MEEKKKGQNTLYAVIGVATLVVAIIGATFAYFSAQATSKDGDIKGGTNDVGASLSLQVNRILFDEEADSTGKYANLVPAVIDENVAGVQKAIDEKCVNESFTGCHLYDISASSTQALDVASIILTDLQVSSTNKENWKYIIYRNDSNDKLTGTNPDAYKTVGTLVTGTKAGDFKTFAETYTTENSGFDMNRTMMEYEGGFYNGGLPENVPVHYYLLVYLANIDNIQNPNAEDTDNAANSGVGEYSGKVILEASSGKIVANFSTSVTPPEENPEP